MQDATSDEGKLPVLTHDFQSVMSKSPRAPLKKTRRRSTASSTNAKEGRAAHGNLVFSQFPAHAHTWPPYSGATSGAMNTYMYATQDVTLAVA